MRRPSVGDVPGMQTRDLVDKLSEVAEVADLPPVAQLPELPPVSEVARQCVVAGVALPTKQVQFRLSARDSAAIEWLRRHLVSSEVEGTPNRSDVVQECIWRVAVQVARERGLELPEW